MTPSKHFSSRSHSRSEIVLVGSDRGRMNAVRILVVGKPGPGKSALIRLLVGDDPSQRDGVIVRHERKDVPIIICENNGVDTARSDQLMVATKALLEGRDPEIDFYGGRRVNGVHAIWYIFSAEDDKVREDGGLLQMLDRMMGKKKLPLLLVMTNEGKRVPAKGGKEVVMAEVLRSISSTKRRESLKASMVRIGRNKVRWDEESVRLLCRRSKELMSKELWSTWAFIVRDIRVQQQQQQQRKPTIKVLVLGEEREDVEELLRAVTNRDCPNSQFHLTNTDNPNRSKLKPVSSFHRDASRPPEDRQSEKAVAASPDIANDLDILVQRLQAIMERVDDDDSSTTLESHDDSDSGKEKLEMAVWESTESPIAFHQPLNIKPLLDMSYAIHPLDVQSPIRAKLNLDCPARANSVESWRKWLYEDGIHLCVLILRRKNMKDNDMYSHIENRLHRFLHRYYGLHDIPDPHNYSKVAAGSPVPLLILHSANDKEVEQVT